MPMLTDLAAALSAGQVPYWEDPGWRNRGHGPMQAPIRAILVHHTAGGGVNDWLTVRNGRPGLAGPLAQLTLERDGTTRILAAGQSWHAGSGSHPLVGTNNGNLRMIGIEGVSPGVGQNAWSTAQLTAYPKLVAALCRWYRLPAAAVIFHKEWARPLGRKIDAGQWPGGPDNFRREVARTLGGAVTPPSPPRILKKEIRDPMAPIPLERRKDKEFRAAVVAESGTRVARLSTLTFGSTFGDSRFVITPLAGGKVVGKQEIRDVKNNASDWYDVPQGARLVTLEITGQNPDTLPAAGIWIT